MSHFLYELVKSLTISEKVHFKRYAKAHGGKDDKNYLKIYDAIDNLKDYDKEVLPKLFKGTTIEKYQSSEVKYLQDKILLSLFNFNLNRTKRNQIYKGILMLEVLSTKGFKKKALKKLRVLKKNALKQEEFTWVLRLIELEESILFKQGIIGYKDKLEELDRQRVELIAIIRNLNQDHILRQEAREFQYSKLLFQVDQKTLKDFSRDPLVESKSNCLSKRAVEHWYYVKVLTNYLQSDFEAGLKASSSYVTFIYENIHLFDSSHILPALSNYIYHAALTKDIQHFMVGQKLLLALSNEEGFDENYIKFILYTRNLELAYCTNDLKLMKEYLALGIRLINTDFHQFEEAQIQYMHLNIVKSAIVLKENSLGMNYCNLWHQRGVLPHRKVQARLFSMILHFNVNFDDLIQSELITLKKLVKKNEREKDLILCFHHFFNSMLKHPEQKAKSINLLQKKLKTISKKNNTCFSFVYFDYYKWSLDLEIKTEVKEQR